MRYPAVLLTAGENDTRVHPLHARKMAAALQAVTAGDHGRRGRCSSGSTARRATARAKPLNLKLRETADERIFLMWQLGMLGPAAVDAPAR